MTTQQPASGQPSPLPADVTSGKKRGIFSKILIGLAVLIAVLVAVVALQPADFKIERSTTIAAPAQAVFEQVNDFHKWDNWSPWAKIDPAMQTKYEGPAEGVGAAYSWVGNAEVGEGRMEIVESRPAELVKIRLDFIKPMPATSAAEFTFKPVGDQTEVTWSMTGKNNFLSKAIHLVLDMDKMVGGMFDQGLADMKKAAEATAKP